MKPQSLAKPSDDLLLDKTLRPKTWQEFVGQEKIKRNLRILIEAARARSETCDHLLFYGPSGLGKTTLAYIIASEFGANLRVTSGAAIERAGDLAALLTHLEEGDILFIDEVHRLNKLIEEILYPAMESQVLHLNIGKGPAARSIELTLPAFTLIAATTRVGLISGPLRGRFGATFRLDFYEEEDIKKILRRSAQVLDLELEEEAFRMLARASRATPRVANRLLKRSRDFAEVEGEKRITKSVVEKTLELLEVDPLGLEATDRRLLETIIQKFRGGPVGIQALAAATQEERETIEDLYEPYLLRLGFLERTSRGRVATAAAYEHLDIDSR
ncbi:MAG: Holliday junction branch migration DNA helicase RuvB [Parcubacteria group bacterium]|nr:Holliday junction branch migration DNA helicase RuvB [Parcubacteria group bacterium]